MVTDLSESIKVIMKLNNDYKNLTKLQKEMIQELKMMVEEERNY